MLTRKNRGLLIGSAIVVALVFFAWIDAGSIPKYAQMLEDHNGAVTAAAIVVMAIFTWILARVGRKQWIALKESVAAAERAADIARDAMVAGERAFIFPTGFTSYWEQPPETGSYNWRFRPNWRNGGDTPTKNMTMHFDCFLRDARLPTDFDFHYPTDKIGKAN